MLRYLTVLALMPVVAIAAPLQDFTFKSPAFNGNGYGSYELQVENTQYKKEG